MKFLKVLAATALVASLATVASCNDDEKTGGGSSSTTTTSQTPTFQYTKGQGNGSTIQLSVHYTASSYHFTPSYQGSAQVQGIGGETLVKGTVLPSWQALGNNLNYKIEDKTDVTKKDLKNEIDGYNKNGYGDLDLIMIDSSDQANAAKNAGKFKDIGALLDEGKLPNFKHWLDNNGGTEGSLWNSMKASDGKVYQLPYFDGLDFIEKVWLMNQGYIEKLLDGELPSTLDSETIPASKLSSFKAHVPFMTNEKVKVSLNGKIDQVVVNFTEAQNIINQQNNLSTKSGASYVKALRDYIDTVYGDYIGANKLYKNRSEIFTSEAACYNADELIALMRCVINNPKFLTDGKQSTVYAFAPRTGEGNRVKQLIEFTNIWGAKGVSAEKGYFYFDGKGKLQDARTKDYMYDNLDSLHELYKEGFFPGNFYTGNGGTVKSEWRSAYVKTGQLFSVYDYNSTSSAFNQDFLGADKSASDIIPMLPPVVKWDDPENSGENNYFHYSEDNRSLKNGGWSILSSTDNLQGACDLADYLWMPEGADIQDYGPNNTSYRKAVTTYDKYGNREAGDGTISVKGQDVVEWSDKVINSEIGTDSFKGSWNNYARKYIGCSHGVGHQRSDGVDYQVTFSAKAKAGLAKISNAIVAGSMRIALSTGDGFFKSVPTNFALSTTDLTNIQNCSENTVLNNFWLSDSSVNGREVYAYWICDGQSSPNVTAVITSLDTIKKTFEKVDSVFLYAYRSAYISNN